MWDLISVSYKKYSRKKVHGCTWTLFSAILRTVFTQPPLAKYLWTYLSHDMRSSTNTVCRSWPRIFIGQNDVVYCFIFVISLDITFHWMTNERPPLGRSRGWNRHAIVYDIYIYIYIPVAINVVVPLEKRITQCQWRFHRHSILRPLRRRRPRTLREYSVGSHRDQWSGGGER